MLPANNKSLNCSKEISPLKERKAGRIDSINPIPDNTFNVLYMFALFLKLVNATSDFPRGGIKGKVQKD
jgi:hypothetical protein